MGNVLVRLLGRQKSYARSVSSATFCLESTGLHTNKAKLQVLPKETMRIMEVTGVAVLGPRPQKVDADVPSP
jgi:hypothetical protein